MQSSINIGFLKELLLSPVNPVNLFIEFLIFSNISIIEFGDFILLGVLTARSQMNPNCPFVIINKLN
tara:strand:+ start:185 stop:385 length:201 start_codon:yes stop_codon:yes gene_type:complete